ncbi:hypothetical protein L9F63_007875, partial [Diploptera punctata]
VLTFHSGDPRSIPGCIDFSLTVVLSMRICISYCSMTYDFSSKVLTRQLFLLIRFIVYEVKVCFLIP